MRDPSVERRRKRRFERGNILIGETIAQFAGKVGGPILPDSDQLLVRLLAELAHRARPPGGRAHELAPALARLFGMVRAGTIREEAREGRSREGRGTLDAIGRRWLLVRLVRRVRHADRASLPDRLAEEIEVLHNQSRCGDPQRLSKRPSDATDATEVIRGHQRPPEAIRGHQSNRDHQMQCDVIICNQRPSEVIRGHQMQSSTLTTISINIRGTQRGHQLPSSTLTCSIISLWKTAHSASVASARIVFTARSHALALTTCALP